MATPSVPGRISVCVAKQCAVLLRPQRRFLPAPRNHRRVIIGQRAFESIVRCAERNGSTGEMLFTTKKGDFKPTME